MGNDLRKELCDRFVAATTNLHCLVYLGLQDNKKNLGQYDLVNQSKTVMLLADKGPASVGQIADFHGCTDYSINRVLQRLHEKKLIRKMRSSHDRRVVICALAPKGRKMLERIDRFVRKRVLPTTENWSLEQIEAFVESMESIHPRRKKMASCTPTESREWFII